MIVGKTILSQTPIAAAVVAILGAFYLLDFDYPKQHEYGMLMIQTLLTLVHIFQGMAMLYRKYKNESS
jgi:hypothetical protein